MIPLQWPDDFQSAAKRSWCWPGNKGREHKRVAEYVSHQLLAREWPIESAWGDEPGRRAIAYRVCQRIQEVYEWPNDHFLPKDSIEIVCLMPWDDLEIVEFVMQLEEEFGIDIPDTEAESWHVLSDIVDSVAATRQSLEKKGK